jgi:hypothetical protein
MVQHDIFFTGAPTSGFDYFPLEFAKDFPPGIDSSTNDPQVFKEYLFGLKKGKAFYACRVPNMRTLVKGGRPNSSFSIILMLEGWQFPSSWPEEKHKEFFDKILYEGVISNAEVLASIGSDDYAFGFTKPGKLESFARELDEIRNGASELFRDTFTDQADFEKITTKRTKNFSIEDKAFRPVEEEESPPAEASGSRRPLPLVDASKAGSRPPNPSQDFLTESVLEHLLAPLDRRVRSLELTAFALTALVVILTAFTAADYLGYIKPSDNAGTTIHEIEAPRTRPKREPIPAAPPSEDEPNELENLNLNTCCLTRLSDDPPHYNTKAGGDITGELFQFDKWPNAEKPARNVESTTEFFIEGLIKFLELEEGREISYSLPETREAVIFDNGTDVKEKLEEILRAENGQSLSNQDVWQRVFEGLRKGMKIVIKIQE